MHDDDANVQSCVLGDWGTSRLRLFLLRNDAVVDTCEGPGIGALTTASAEGRVETLAGLVARWMNGAQPIRVLLGGMAGSRNGLFESPYAALPADSATWARAARTIETGRMRITIAAGLKSTDECVGADVMRGEETQIFGAMQLDPALRRGTHVVVLPGTHSKWVEIADGSIARFRTAMTGELYALLRDGSTLLRTGAAAANALPENDADRDPGFAAGVARSSELHGGLLAALFEARAAQLVDHRSKSWAAGFLSGLLIGHEVVAMSESFQSPGVIRLIGDPGLVALYQGVLSQRGADARALGGAQCAIAGLAALRASLPEH
jgi:2-dehydro-3-deoxygalactonokinase